MNTQKPIYLAYNKEFLYAYKKIKYSIEKWAKDIQIQSTKQEIQKAKET